MISCRSDWETVKVKVMFELLLQKFNDPTLSNWLVSTDPMELVEVNNHGDRFWGTDKFLKGENNLGQLLMQVRDILLSL